MKLKLGTRGSDLALAQAHWTAGALRNAGCEIEIVTISTAGDRSQAPSFGSIGPQGVFVTEIEQALSAKQVDIAVHSYKDLPTAPPAGLTVAAVPTRVDAADYLLVRKDAYAGLANGLLPLQAGASVGTSSARRQAWLRHFRGDINILPLRGNVPTRVRRLASGDYDAIVLAHAGIERLRESGDTLDALLADIEMIRLDPALFVPAPAQGALALQCRTDEAAVRDLLSALDHPPSRQAVTAERGLLALAEGGCDAAFGAYCHAGASGFELRAMTESSGKISYAEASGETTDAVIRIAWDALAGARVAGS
jgi:hydroxymethylbilane synthase